MQYLHIQPTTNLLSELDGQSWESCVHAEGWTHTYTHTKPEKQTNNNTKIFVLSDDLIYSLDEYIKVDIRTRVCAKSYLELLFARMQALHEWPETIIIRGKFCINDSRIALLLLSARQLPISLNKEHFMAFQTVSTDAGRKKKWHQKKKKNQSNEIVVSDRRTLAELLEEEPELYGRPHRPHLCEYKADKDTRPNVIQTRQK